LPVDYRRCSFAAGPVRLTGAAALMGAMPMAVAVAVFCGSAGLSTAWAHEGPPFAILMDQPAAGYVVSVWADPDIGEAQFFIIVEMPDGKQPQEPPSVTMWVQPVSGRLEPVTWRAEHKPLRNQMQFEANPHFDRGDQWKIGIRLTQSDGTSGELTTEVESTPPGYGRWDFAIYLFPFLLLGGFWVIVMVRRNRMTRALQNPSADPLT